MAESQPSPASNISPALEKFRAAFAVIDEPPYCTGSVPLDPATSKLFYSSNGKAAVVDFTDASNADLKALSDACQPASFGLDKQDVLDESYRKAGKMDTASFATQFSLSSSGILHSLVTSFFQGQYSTTSVNAELYKLNIYGPGSFFKSHVDTPRSDTMFGSLVVVFPTVHEGGCLKFRHSGQEWSFDSAKVVSSTAEPQIAFAAFYSDIEHEVLPVASGYRVTLTYNLHTAPNTIPKTVRIEDHPGLPQMKTSLAGLLADPSFLPNGGLLGFGLSYRYPFNPSSTKLEALSQRLKGTDSEIQRICEALSLEVSLKAVYGNGSDDWRWNSKYFCLATSFVECEYPIEEPVAIFLRDSKKGEMVYDCDAQDQVRDEYEEYYRRDGEVPAAIAWIKPLKRLNPFESAYIAYGNEACLNVAYGEVCLVAKVGSTKARLAM